MRTRVTDTPGDARAAEAEAAEGMRLNLIAAVATLAIVAAVAAVLWARSFRRRIAIPLPDDAPAH